MVETRWPALEGEVLQYAGRQWELTGDLAIRSTGELLEVEAKQVNDVRQERTTLHFGLDSPPSSLNPGDLEGHFQELDQAGDEYALVVTRESREYRYELHGMTPE